MVVEVLKEITKNGGEWGYFSFGAVILVGIALALIFTLIVLPPLLRLVKRR